MDAPEEPLPPVIYTMENKPIVTCECSRRGRGRRPLRAARHPRPHPGARGPAPRAPGPAASWNGGVAGAAAAAGPPCPRATSGRAGTRSRAVAAALGPRPAGGRAPERRAGSPGPRPGRRTDGPLRHTVPFYPAGGGSGRSDQVCVRGRLRGRASVLPPGKC